jgi:2-oxoglutarate dehydrogenase E1 component
VADELGHYANVEKVIWAQEEPKNSGAWFFVAPRIRTATRHFLKKVRRTPTCLLTD